MHISSYKNIKQFKKIYINVLNFIKESIFSSSGRSLLPPYSGRR